MRRVEERARVENFFDTTENWEKSNPVLLKGEYGVEKKTGGKLAIKVGDGMTAWKNLSYLYVQSDSASDAEAIAELQKQITNLEDYRNELKSQIEALQYISHTHENKEFLDGIGYDIESRFEKMYQTLSSVDKTLSMSIENLEIAVNNLKNSSHTHENKEYLDSVETTISSIDSRVTTSENKINVLVEWQGTQNEYINDINVKISGIETNVNSIDERVTTTESKISVLENWQTTQNDYINDINTRISQHVSDNKASFSAITDWMNDHTTFSNNMNTEFSGRIAALETDMNSLKTTLEDVVEVSE